MGVMKIEMSEEEIFRMLLVEKLDKFPLLNELFAIRDSRGKRNDYTICVNGYISLDVINKAIEKVNLLNSLKEIEKSHKEENGKLRVELEQEKSKIEALEKQHEYDMEMIDEVKGQANEWINMLEQEKEKNKELQLKYMKLESDRYYSIRDMMKYREFENEVNETIEGLEVQDIKYSTAIYRDGTILYSAMIIYC